MLRARRHTPRPTVDRARRQRHTRRQHDIDVGAQREAARLVDQLQPPRRRPTNRAQSQAPPTPTPSDRQRRRHRHRHHRHRRHRRHRRRRRRRCRRRSAPTHDELVAEVTVALPDVFVAVSRRAEARARYRRHRACRHDRSRRRCRAVAPSAVAALPLIAHPVRAAQPATARVPTSERVAVGCPANPGIPRLTGARRPSCQSRLHTSPTLGEQAAARGRPPGITRQAASRLRRATPRCRRETMTTVAATSAGAVIDTGFEPSASATQDRPCRWVRELRPVRRNIGSCF